MKLVRFLKDKVENLPESWARPLAYVPFSLRLGWPYLTYSKKCKMTETNHNGVSIEEHYLWLSQILNFTSEHNQFYKNKYSEIGYKAASFQTISDWKNVPIIDKSEFKKYSIDIRRTPHHKGLLVNTGGTSGAPLEFLLDKHAFAREWAHMHHIWVSRGYRKSHVKLTFRGKHFEADTAVKFNAVHNEYVVNANSSMDDVIKAVLQISQRVSIKWIHGYPSLIADFANALALRSSEEIFLIRHRLRGVLLGSEFPAPIYRNAIESILSTNIVSWYGHSEMSVLAKEVAHGIYQSLPTYGFAEAVPTTDGKAYRLVVTSYHNRVHPFIRYDTGDLIEPISQIGGVLTFRIAQGRIGDYITDNSGKRHSLTAIIFGRHHEAFNKIQHVQVRQEDSNLITLVVTPNNKEQAQEIKAGFDLADLPFTWQFEFVEEPVRTPAGKIRLKI